jgi:mannose-6-phosphate isomerase-like protein (cupin superfamily)
MMTNQKISLAQKFDVFQDYWSPRIVAELNDNYVKLAKLSGEFVWHHHESEDELFLVIKGRLLMKFRNGETTLGPGELLVVPRGVEHCPVALEETQVVLIEPKQTLHTGDQRTERTVSIQDQSRI